MFDKSLYRNFQDDFGGMWVELLTSDLNEHAKMCFISMVSFGKNSNPSKEDIKIRMGVGSSTTVKQAQRELMQKGWIVLLQEGYRHFPRTWWINSSPNEHVTNSKIKEKFEFAKNELNIKISPTSPRTRKQTVSVRKRFLIFKRDKFTCAYCGEKAPNVQLQVDHVIPKSKGGSDDPSNLTTACADCNLGKGSIQLEGIE